MSVRIALLRLAATPMFTVFAVVSLASGVAITTAVYSVVDQLMLRGLGVPQPDRAVFLVTTYAGRPARALVSAPDFDDARHGLQSLSSLSASDAILPSVASTSHAEIVAAEAVDGAYFATLRVGAARGRVIQPEDDRAFARVAVLSDELWRTRFASDPDAIGRAIRINGLAFEVVGVAPPGFSGLHGVLRPTRLWMTRVDHAVGTKPPSGRGPRDHRTLTVFGRLARGATEAQASAELSTIASRLDSEFPPPPTLAGRLPSERMWSARRFDLIHRDEDNALRRFGLAIVALVALVLVVACTNLANLVLARGTARQGELAVRMAMGASRGRLIWEQCLESLMLAAAGAAASIVIFQVVSAMMTSDFTIGPVRAATLLSIRPSLDGPAVGVALVATILALLVFGLEPAVQLARTLDIRTALAVGATGVRPRAARQRMVIRWQVAIAAGFFILATMFIRGTLNLAAHDSGVALDRVAIATLNFDNGVWDDQRIRRVIDRVIEEGAKDPAIESVSASTGLPFGIPPAMQVAVAAADNPEGLSLPPQLAVAVTPAFFTTMGIPLSSGRPFTDDDAVRATTTVILSELTARSFFHATDVVGRSVAIRQGEKTSIAEIVGVARDTDTRFIYSDRRPLVYLPLAPDTIGDLTLTARSSGTAAQAVAALREAIRQADPDAAVDAIGTGRAVLTGPFELLRSLGMGTLYIGGFTLLLSMVGLFGVQSHVVSHRTREIGVRMSVGATARQIKLMVIKDAYRPVLEGLVLGLWGGLAGRVIARAYMDVDVAVVDPWMLLLTPLPLVLAAFVACYWPASRAASVNPTVALRCE
jgi:putative ABC transport system permease protein